MIKIEKDGVSFSFDSIEDAKKFLDIIKEVKINIEIKYSYPWTYSYRLLGGTSIPAGTLQEPYTIGWGDPPAATTQGKWVSHPV